VQVKQQQNLLEQVVSESVLQHAYDWLCKARKGSGFDFLVYRITAKTKDKVSLAWKTIANHIDKLQQLYQQGAKESRIAEYVKHWLQWVRSGVEIDLDDVLRLFDRVSLGGRLKGRVFGVREFLLWL